MNRKIKNIQNKEILFLQGPMGSFFKKIQLELLENNLVFRIGFNKGDEFFSLKNNFYPFRDNPRKWRSFINLFIKNKKIKIIFLFGDCRFYHKIAIEEAKKLNVDAYVFEEGYIRPNYITLEKNGVNFYSEIIKEKLSFILKGRLFLLIRKNKKSNTFTKR